MWISGTARRINELLSSVQLVSAIVFVVLFFATAASLAVTASSVEFTDSQIDPVVARQFPNYGATLLFVFGMRMAAMFVFTTSNIGRHAKILPLWFVIISFVVGAFLLLSASFSRVLALVFPIWVIILSLILLDRALRIPKDLVMVRPAPIAPAVVVVREGADDSAT
jgi:hypothetical protein